MFAAGSNGMIVLEVAPASVGLVARWTLVMIVEAELICRGTRLDCIRARGRIFGVLNSIKRSGRSFAFTIDRT